MKKTYLFCPFWINGDKHVKSDQIKSNQKEIVYVNVVTWQINVVDKYDKFRGTLLIA